MPKSIWELENTLAICHNALRRCLVTLAVYEQAPKPLSRELALSLDAQKIHEAVLLNQLHKARKAYVEAMLASYPGLPN